MSGRQRAVLDEPDLMTLMVKLPQSYLDRVNPRVQKFLGSLGIEQ